MGKLRLGIMGGTFDPIHKGHVMIARNIQEQLHLDRVLFIPAYVSPFKQDQHSLPAEDRMAMTLLACQDNPLFTVSSMELQRGGVSYTSDTLRKLYRRWHRFYDLYFIIGADSAEQLPGWHNIREAMQYATFAAAARPGFAPHKDRVTAMLHKAGLHNFLWVDTPEMAVSSTEIRQRLQAGQPITDMVPKAVAEYIEQRDLYRR